MIIQCDPNFTGLETIRNAREDQPVHLLLHEKKHEVVFPYLVAFQSMLALRTIEANKGVEIRSGFQAKYERACPKAGPRTRQNELIHSILRHSAIGDAIWK